MCPAGTTRRRTSSPKSRRGESTFPRMFLRGMSPGCQSTSSRPSRGKRNPRGLPQTQQAWSLWTRTPRTKRLYSLCSRGMARVRPKPWTQSQSPARRTGETNTSPGWIEGNSPWTGPRPDASPGWPSHSPLLTASCTSAPRRASCSNVCPSLRGASSFGTFTWAYAATTRRHALSWATHSARASTGPLRSRTPARSCAPAKGASFTPQDQPSCARPPNHPRHMALCRVGIGYHRALAKSAWGLHPPTGCRRQILQVG
jgi:hypothetical protein